MRNPCPIEPQNHVKIRGPPSTYGPSRPFSPLLRHLVRSDDGRPPPFVEDPLGFPRLPRPRPPRVKLHFSPPSLGSFGTKSSPRERAAASRSERSRRRRAAAAGRAAAQPRRPAESAESRPPAGPWRAPAAAENRVEAHRDRAVVPSSIANILLAVPRERGAARALLGHGERAWPAGSPGPPGGRRRRRAAPALMPTAPAGYPAAHGHSRLSSTFW